MGRHYTSVVLNKFFQLFIKTNVLIMWVQIKNTEKKNILIFK